MDLKHPVVSMLVVGGISMATGAIITNTVSSSLNVHNHDETAHSVKHVKISDNLSTIRAAQMLLSSDINHINRELSSAKETRKEILAVQQSILKKIKD